MTCCALECFWWLVDSGLADVLADDAHIGLCCKFHGDWDHSLAYSLYYIIHGIAAAVVKVFI